MSKMNSAGDLKKKIKIKDIKDLKDPKNQKIFIEKVKADKISPELLKEILTGVPELTKAFTEVIKAMKDIHPDARLLIGGVGPLTPKLKELVARLGLEKRINFLGLIKEKDLPAYYQASDIFCLPAISQAEAFGIVQVEAMASGLPVVSTELHNGVSYVNRDGVSGLVVPPNDSNALAIAINKLLDNDELRNKLAMQARERALKEFSFESMGQRMLKLYEDVVAART